MTHICVGKRIIISSDNGLLPGRRQAIIWTNAGILLIRPLGTNFSEVSIEIHIFSLMKMHFKMSSAKCRSFCFGLNVLIAKCMYVCSSAYDVALNGELKHKVISYHNKTHKNIINRHNTCGIIFVVWFLIFILFERGYCKYSFNPKTPGNAWMRSRHHGCWCPGVKARGQQYPQCWLNIHCIGPVSYKNITLMVNNITKWNYIFAKNDPVV